MGNIANKKFEYHQDKSKCCGRGTAEEMEEKWKYMMGQGEGQDKRDGIYYQAKRVYQKSKNVERHEMKEVLNAFYSDEDKYSFGDEFFSGAYSAKFAWEGLPELSMKEGIMDKFAEYIHDVKDEEEARKDAEAGIEYIEWKP